MTDIKIMCAYDKMVDVVELVPNPRNPNKHPEKQIILLAKLIEKQGFRKPIVVSNRSGFMTSGHGRLLAALHLGMEAVPVDYQDYANEAAEWQDMVADNKVAEYAEFDNEMLSEIIDELEAFEDLDEELLGMVQSDIDKLMGRFERMEQQNKSQEIQLEAFDDDKFEHCCPRCGFRY